MEKSSSSENLLRRIMIYCSMLFARPLGEKLKRDIKAIKAMIPIAMIAMISIGPDGKETIVLDKNIF